MPFDPSKKKQKTPTEPTYKQNLACSAIDKSYGDLVTVLLTSGAGNPEMRNIISTLNSTIAGIKLWVLDN